MKMKTENIKKINKINMKTENIFFTNLNNKNYNSILMIIL